MTDNMDLSKGGVKHDAGKPAIDLIAPELVFGTAAVLEVGARKYSVRNWETGMRWGRPFAALMRHLWAWWRGEKYDPETGLPHLWCAACNLMFLIAYEERGIGQDDRSKGASDGEEEPARAEDPQERRLSGGNQPAERTRAQAFTLPPDW